MQKKKRNIYKPGKAYVVCLPEDEKDHAHLMAKENRAYDIEKLISTSAKQRTTKGILSGSRIKAVKPH
ncbi:MAG: hypothetical protein KBF32_09450 [Chitinophagales bacterium]|nr:hypothetical protein [Chitinophagales bacterium]